MRAGIRWGMSLTKPNIGVAWSGLIAGKPAPTEIFSEHGFVRFADPCGSGLARDEASRNTTHSELSPHPRLQTQMRPLPRFQAQAVSPAACGLYANEFGYLVPAHPQQRP